MSLLPLHIEKRENFSLDVIQVFGGSLFLALLSQIKIPLFFTPVPLTLQTLGILLMGAFLGSRKTVAAILVYFGQIVAGLPVTSGWMSDPLIFVGPKGGYVLGFLLQGALMGWICERSFWTPALRAFTGALIGCSVQMASGALFLSQFIGLQAAWTMGVAPFIVGEILKSFIAAYFYQSITTNKK